MIRQQSRLLSGGTKRKKKRVRRANCVRQLRSPIGFLALFQGVKAKLKTDRGDQTSFSKCPYGIIGWRRVTFKQNVRES